jgi:hypothetical protein
MRTSAVEVIGAGDVIAVVGGARVVGDEGGEGASALYPAAAAAAATNAPATYFKNLRRPAREDSDTINRM